MQALYHAKATATGGGREGHASTSDGILDVTLTTPKELGGNGAVGTNPEQLFATGYSACFLGALKFAASKQKISFVEDPTVTATVGIGQRDDGEGFGLVVTLEVRAPGIEPAVVEDLIQRADVICPYSHATRGNVQVEKKAIG